MQQLQPVINTVTCYRYVSLIFLHQNSDQTVPFQYCGLFYFGALIISRFSLNISYALCSCWISNGYIIISSSSLIIYFHCLVCTLMPLFNTINMHFPLTMQPCSSVVLQSRTRWTQWDNGFTETYLSLKAFFFYLFSIPFFFSLTKTICNDCNILVRSRKAMVWLWSCFT